MAAENFLIWKRAYAPNGWYRPNSCGYTNDVVEAGRFTEEYARHHEQSSSGDCTAIEYGSEEMEKLLKHFDYTAWKLYQAREAQTKRCVNCDWFKESPEGYPSDMVNDSFGPNFCSGYEMSCDRNDIRFCFTLKRVE